MECDKDAVIFHYSRQEQYRFLWEDIPRDSVQVGTWQGGYMLIILTGGKQKRVGLNRSASGFKDLEQTMEEAGVLKRIGLMTKEDYEQVQDRKCLLHIPTTRGHFLGR